MERIELVGFTTNTSNSQLSHDICSTVATFTLAVHGTGPATTNKVEMQLFEFDNYKYYLIQVQKKKVLPY